MVSKPSISVRMIKANPAIVSKTHMAFSFAIRHLKPSFNLSDCPIIELLLNRRELES